MTYLQRSPPYWRAHSHDSKARATARPGYWSFGLGTLADYSADVPAAAPHTPPLLPLTQSIPGIEQMHAITLAPSRTTPWNPPHTVRYHTRTAGPVAPPETHPTVPRPRTSTLLQADGQPPGTAGGNGRSFAHIAISPLHLFYCSETLLGSSTHSAAHSAQRTGAGWRRRHVLVIALNPVSGPLPGGCYAGAVCNSTAWWPCLATGTRHLEWMSVHWVDG